MQDPQKVPFTIPNGTALSGVVNLQGLEVVGIIMPATWTAAGMTFQSADDPDAAGGGTYQNVFNSAGTELSFTVVQANRVLVDPNVFGAHAAVKVRSGTAGAPVNQGADRTGYLVCRRRVTR